MKLGRTRVGWWWAWALGACVGCRDEVNLGKRHALDAGGITVDAGAADGSRPADLGGAPGDRCVPAGTVFGRSDAAVEGTQRLTVRVQAVRAVRNSADLRLGSAVAWGSSLVWAVSDNRCGVRDGRRWWGVLLGRLTRDPDRPLEDEWTCLPESFAGLVGHPFVTSAGLGVAVREHPMQRTDGSWREGEFRVGSVVDEPPDFAENFAPDALQYTAQMAVRDDGIDLIYQHRAGERAYARLDASQRVTSGPWTLGPGGEGLTSAMSAPLPWQGDRFLAAWNVSFYGATSDQFEVFTSDGRVESRVDIAERLGMAGVPLTTAWMQRAECGVEMLLSEGATSTVQGTYYARLWEDGRWSISPLARRVRMARVVARGDVRIAAYVEADESAVGVMAFDARGAILMPPTQIEMSYACDVGDLAVLPGSDDLALMYSSRESEDDPVVAKVAVLAVGPP